MSSASELEVWVDDYLDYLRLERNLSEHSVSAYARDLSKLVAFAVAEQLTHPDAVDEGVLNRLLAVRSRAGDSPRSRARMLSGWRGFFRYLLEEEAVDNDPTELLSNPKITKSLPSLLSEEEVSDLLSAPDDATPRGIRDIAMLELLYATGLRVSELVGTQPSTPDLPLLVNSTATKKSTLWISMEKTKDPLPRMERSTYSQAGLLMGKKLPLPAI